MFLSDGKAIGWLIRSDLGQLRGLDDKSLWKWKPTSAEFRDRIARLERRVDRRKPAFEPCPRVSMYWWPSRAAMRAEEGMRPRWIDVAACRKWKPCRVDIHLHGSVYPNRPVSDVHP